MYQKSSHTRLNWSIKSSCFNPQRPAQAAATAVPCVGVSTLSRLLVRLQLPSIVSVPATFWFQSSVAPHRPLQLIHRGITAVPLRTSCPTSVPLGYALTSVPQINYEIPCMFAHNKPMRPCAIHLTINDFVYTIVRVCSQIAYCEQNLAED